VLLLTQDISRITRINFTNFVMYQIGVEFGIHLAAALYTNRIHACGGALIRISARIARRKGLPVRSQLHLAGYIEKFHTKKRYGITYMGYGLISFKSFFKVSKCETHSFLNRRR